MTAVLASLVICLSSPLADRLEPKPLSSFDGKSWAGLTIGNITDGGIKKQFQTEKGAVRPEGLKLVTTKDSGVRVDALLDGRGDKAVMRAIRVEYEVPLSISDLSRDLGENPIPMYTSERHEDWRVLAFVDHGVLAVDLSGRADTFILCSPSQVRTALREFGDRQSDVTTPIDPGKNWDRIVRFSDSDSTVTLGSDKPDWMDSDWRRRLGRRLENEAESVRESSLRYASSGDGRLTISVTTDRFKSGEAEFKVSTSLRAATPYGTITQSASRSRKLGESFDRKLVDLFEDAVSDLARDVRNAVQKLGPPPRDQARKTAINRLMDGATRKPSS